MASFASAKPFTPLTASSMTTSTASNVISRARRSSSAAIGSESSYTSSTQPYQQGLDFMMPSPSPPMTSTSTSHLITSTSSSTPGLIDMHAADKLARACADAKMGLISISQQDTSNIMSGEHMPVYHYEQTGELMERKDTTTTTTTTTSASTSKHPSASEPTGVNTDTSSQ